jgi:hypothetical protein
VADTGLSIIGGLRLAALGAGSARRQRWNFPRRPFPKRISVMKFSSWLRNRKQHAPARKRPTFRPALEVLEGRWVPATLTVTNPLDDGSTGSLRFEIAAAHSGDHIVFAGSLHAITLTGGELVVGKNLDIEGPGATHLSVSGNNASRVFDITNNATATIAGLTIANGSAMSTTDASRQGGGGVLNEPGCTIYITNDVFSNNHALVASGALENAGGPGGPASAIVSGTTFIGNQAVGSVNGTTNPFLAFDGFGPGNGTAEGGAIDDDGNLTLANCAFINNQAAGVPGSDGINASAHGGALAVDGAATITGTVFTGNQALGAAVPSGFASSQGLGGGVVVFGSASLGGCRFTGNRAVGGAGNSGPANSPAFVGAGGGILALGGGVLTVDSSIFTGNQALGGAGGTGGGGLAFGGGIDVHAGTTATLSNSVFHNNAAIGGAGGIGHAGGAGAGGGLSVEIFAVADISGVAISGNQAVGGAGGAGANGGGGYGGGIAVGGRTIYDGADGSAVSISDSLLNNNAALGGVGGIGGNGGNGYGGGAFVGATEGSVTPSLAVSNSNINANRADGGAGGVGGSAGAGVGGGVYSLGDFSASDTNINGNDASTSNDNLFP